MHDSGAFQGQDLSHVGADATGTSDGATSHDKKDFTVKPYDELIPFSTWHLTVRSKVNAKLPVLRSNKSKGQIMNAEEYTDYLDTVSNDDERKIAERMKEANSTLFDALLHCLPLEKPHGLRIAQALSEAWCFFGVCW